jgi:branched-chain amino acid transport system substrate-binding protein
MINFSKLTQGLFVSGLAVAAFAAADLPALAQQTQPIRIASTLPLTGGAAGFGEAARWGAEMAIKEINAAGGIGGRAVEVEFQDNRCNPAEGVKVATDMLSSKRYVAMFDGLCSSVILAIMPVAERAQIPLMVATASATAISDKSGAGGNQWTFKFNPSDATLAAAMVGWLDKQGQADKIAFLGEDTDFGRSGSQGFDMALKKISKTLASEDYYQQGTADFSATLTKLRALRPQVLALYSLSADQLNIVQQMQGLNLKVPLTGRVQTDAVPKELLASGALDGSSSVQPYSAEIDTPANQAFVKAFTAAYGKEPNSISYSAYEAMRTLVDAIKRAPSAEPAAIREAITKTKFPSMLGGDIEFDANNLAHNFAVILRIEGGRARVVGVSKT